MAAQGAAVTAGTLPGNSTAGNLLIALVGGGGSSGTITPPSGWSTIVNSSNSTVVNISIFAYFNNPGGLASFTFSGGPATYILSVAEFTCVNVSSVLTASDTGTAVAGAVTAITVTTNGSAGTGDLVITTSFEHLNSANSITWTDPGGFTEFAGLKLASSTNHEYSAYDLAATAGGIQSVTMTSSVASTNANGWGGVVATFSQPYGPGAVFSSQQSSRLVESYRFVMG
jgi:hypothetical protein